MRTSRAIAFKCSTALMATLAFSGAPAYAQASDDSGASQGGLDEIVVTALRREESAQKAAVAITAISADTLRQAGLTDAKQLTNIAPALHINAAYGPASNFYVRGVGNLVLNASSDSAVIFNVDGIPLARPTGVQGLFFDMSRVEVLKGPQGTLYGRNATGGAVNIITAQPEFDRVSGFINGSYGNYDAIKAEGAINLPIGENTAVRIAGLRSKMDGTMSDGTGDEDVSAVRLTLASQVSDSLKLTFGVDYAHQGGVGPGATAVGMNFDDRIGLLDARFTQAFYNRALNPAPFPFSAAGFAAVSGNVLRPHSQIVNGLRPYQDNDFWGLRMQADLETSVGTVSLIPSYRESKLNYLAVAVGPTVLSEEKDKQTSIELRLVSPSDNKLQYILGAFYFNERVKSMNDYNFQYTSFHALIQPKTDSYAAYGRLTYEVAPNFRLNGGLRYTIDKKSTDDVNFNETVYCPGFFGPVPYAGGPAATCVGAPSLPLQLAVTPGIQVPAPAPLSGTINIGYAGVNGSFLNVATQPNSGSETFRRLTWRVAAEYDAGPSSLLYASVESGYKAGGFFNTPDQNNNMFRPETILAYTIGSKNRFLDNKLQVNLEAFWWQYKDQQVSHFISVGGTPVFATENIGKSRYRGVELEMQAKVTDNTRLDATIQYLDARNTSFRYGSAVPPNTGCANGLGGPGGAAFFVDCTGVRPSNAPVWTLQGGIEQRIPLGGAGNLFLRANTRYQSGSWTGIEYLPEQYQEGYFTSGAQIEFRTEDDKFSIAGFIDNIEDNNTVGYSQPHNFAGHQSFVILQRPRTYGIRAGYNF